MPQSRDEAAALIGAAFPWLREDLGPLDNGTYDADAHNSCTAFVELQDGHRKTLFAYSDSSRMNKKNREFYEIPDPSQYADRFGLSHMQAAHTEAKLLNYVINTYSQGNAFKHVTLATARAPCKSCSKVIAQFEAWYPNKITVHHFSAEQHGGKPDLSGTPYGKKIRDKSPKRK